MSPNQFGIAQREGRLLDGVANSGTTPIPAITRIYDYKGIGLQLITTGTLAGAWKLYVSNIYSLGGMEDGCPAVSDANAQWSDVTAMFAPTVNAVVSGGSNQFTQAFPLVARALKVVFTPTSGSGTASAYAVANNY